MLHPPPPSTTDLHSGFNMAEGEINFTLEYIYIYIWPSISLYRFIKQRGLLKKISNLTSAV